MSKCSRPLTLILTIILSFSFLSVNSFAAESTNLVDGNLSNWIDIGETDPKYFQSANVFDYGNGYNYIEVYSSSKSVLLVDLTEFLKIGESYRFSFGLPTTDGINNVALSSCNILWGLLDGGGYTDASSLGESVFEIIINNENKTKFLGKSTSYEFTYTQGFKNTYLALVIEPREDLTSYNYLQLYISDIKLERVASESEQKLDGILGWLQELWNTISGLPGKISESVKGFFDDLSSKITGLGESIKGFFDDLKLKIETKIDEIKQSIHDFFVPPEGFFDNWKMRFNSMLEHNLGFVYQAPNFVVEVVYCIQDVLNTKTEPNLVFPKVEFDIVGYHVVLFENTKVDFSFLESGIWSTVYGMYKVMVHAILAFALIKFAQDTWERTMSN